MSQVSRANSKTKFEDGDFPSEQDFIDFHDSIPFLLEANTFTERQTIQLTTEQLRLGYDASNYFSTTVASNGTVSFSITAASGSPNFNFYRQVITQSPLQVASTFYGGGNSVYGSNLGINGNVGGSTTGASLLYGGASTVSLRIAELGSAYTLGANESYGGHIIGANSITEAASGTHAWVSSLVVKPLTITDGAATTTNSATLYIDGAPTGATNNWALYVNGNVSSFNGGSIFNAGYYSGTNVNIGNFSVVTPTTAFGGIVQSEVLYGGASAISARIVERGSSNFTLPANESFGGHIIGAQAVTEAASGTHAWMSSLVVKPLTITAGAATTTNSATLYIDGAPSGATNNYSLYVTSGLAYLGGGAYIGGIQTSTTAESSCLYTGTSGGNLTTGWTLGGSTGVTFRNMFGGATPIVPVGVNHSYGAHYFRTGGGVTSAGSGTNPVGANVVIEPPSLTVGTAAWTNGAALWVTGASTGATNNYALYVAGGESRFLGAIKTTQFKLSALNSTPASATDTGTLGDIKITADYIYICTATNTWVRAALATW
jgi:hypothetical protein